jgi:hypothetical protein
MNSFVVALAFSACVYGAPAPDAEAQYGYGAVPTGYAGHHGVVAAGYAAAPVAVSAPLAVGQTHHTYAAGPPVVQEHVQYGVVGHQTVQVGTQQVQAGHQYVQSHQEVIPQPAHTYVAGEPQTIVETRALPAPAIPFAPAPYAAIPPAPVNLGPAPADTVTQQRILAPVRTHTRITPVQTNIVPQLQVNKYNVDVPVQVAVPVEREVIVQKHVAKPYTVQVPRAVPVPAPYKVHPVHEVVEQPIVHHATYTQTHHAVAAVHAAPVAVAHAAPAAVGYAHAAVAPAAVGYAHAAPAALGYAYAAYPAVAGWASE